jgi:uncharacterized protein (TIGR02145 family)
MKQVKSILKYYFFTMICFSFFLTSCEKKSPSVTTISTINISHNSATSGGNVTDEGDGAVNSRGIVWGKDDPTIEKNEGLTSGGNGTGIFTGEISNLQPYTDYQVKAFATNKYGTSYGEVQKFKTLPAFASVITINATEITDSSAKVGGNISDNGGVDVSERGVYYDIINVPEVSGMKVVSGSGSGLFSTTVNGLSGGTTYYVRAYAINLKGRTLGDVMTFTTNRAKPRITTREPFEILSTSAKSGGTNIQSGGSEITDKGIYYGTQTDPKTTGISITGGQGSDTFTGTMNYLRPGTRYYVVAYARNNLGTGYGNVISFVTIITKPVVSTSSVTAISASTAAVGGMVTSNGGADVTERGIYWGTSASPETNGTKQQSGSGTGSFSYILTGLSQNTTYYIKAYAINSEGESRGSVVSFTTGVSSLTGSKIYNPDLTYGNVTDIEGNSYKTIVVGTQTWFAENLKTTTNNDGSLIPNVTDNNLWTGLTTPAYCWYENNIDNKDLTGAKYNWYAVNTGKLCPTGWHVPSDAEWTVLTDYLGGTDVAGAKIKETGRTHWISPNEGATNSSGFTSLPGGQRQEDGIFTGLGLYDVWWSTTEYNIYKPWYRSNSYNNTQVFAGSGSLKTRGFSVRCIKD